MNLKKLFLSISIIFTLCLAFGITANAATEVASGQCGYNDAEVYWKLDSEGTLTIYGNGRMSGYHRTLAPTPWVSYCNAIKTLVVKNGVYGLGSAMCYDCKNLNKVIIEYGVQYIASGAFENCPSLTNIEIPTSIIDLIGFTECSSITDVYYMGSMFEWQEIDFGNWEYDTEKLNIHYNIKYTFSTIDGTYITSIRTPYGIDESPLTVFDNKTIVGWYETANLAGEAVTFPYSKNDTDTMLYAKMVCIITYTGDLEDSFPVEEGSNIDLPTAPEGYEYRFYVDGEEWNGKNITGNVNVEVELINLAAQCDILSIKSPTGGTLIDQTIDFTVANNLTSITPDFNLSDGATWKMYRNATFTSENTSKTLNNLVAGAEPRIAYIRVTAADGVTTKDYTISVYRNTKATPPIVTINGATVTIASESGDIYYTTDGSEPTANSLKYTEPFTAKSEAVIKALVIDSAKDEYSDITTNTVPKYITTTLEKDYLSIDANAKTASFGFIITSNGEPTGVFIVALYDENACLIGCKTINISTATDYVEDNTLIYSGTPHTYKAFFWNSLNTLTPMCESIGSEI